VMAHSEEQAERWLADGMKTAGLKAKDLPDLKGSDPRKLAIAELLWKRTNVSQQLRLRLIERKPMPSCPLRCGASSNKLGTRRPER